METRASTATTTTRDMPTVNEVHKEVMELKQMLADVKNALDGHTKSITSRMKKLEDKIDQKHKELQEYFDTEMKRFIDRCDELEERVEKIEKAEISRATYNPESTVIAAGLQESEDEDIKEKAASLVRQGLGLRDVPVIRATRLASRGPKPGLVKIQLDSLENKKRVLKNKLQLKDSDNYGRVFVRSSKSHTDRLIELNFRKLLEYVPGGQDLRLTGNGRLVLKDREAGRGTGGRVQQRGDPELPEPEIQHVAVERH